MKREQRQDTGIKDKVQRETGSTDSPHELPPPYNSDSVDSVSKDILTNGTILFSGVLELICEQENDETIVVQNCSQCSSIIPSAMLNMIEQNFKESLNIPRKSHLYLAQEPSSRTGREKSTLLEFSTK